MPLHVTNLLKQIKYRSQEMFHQVHTIFLICLLLNSAVI